MSKTRRVECHACGGDVQFPLQHSFDGPDIKCGHCGALISSRADACRIAADRLTLEDAAAIAGRYTYDQVVALARRLYDDPSSATSEEMDALCAFNLLRQAGLPAHAPKQTQ